MNPNPSPNFPSRIPWHLNIKKRKPKNNLTLVSYWGDLESRLRQTAIDSTCEKGNEQIKTGKLIIMDESSLEITNVFVEVMNSWNRVQNQVDACCLS